MSENFKSMTLKLIKNSRYELVVFSDKCTTGRWGNIHKQIYVGNSPKRPRQHWAERNFHVFHIKYLQVTTWFLVIFVVYKYSSKTRNCTSPTDSCNFLSLKNLLVLINNKLHSKSLPIHCEVKREAVKRVLKEKNIKKMAGKKIENGNTHLSLTHNQFNSFDSPR